ncbi:5504_t:CDS:2, partial [Scutellospora calospora]
DDMSCRRLGRLDAWGARSSGFQMKRWMMDETHSYHAMRDRVVVYETNAVLSCLASNEVKLATAIRVIHDGGATGGLNDHIIRAPSSQATCSASKEKSSSVCRHKETPKKTPTAKLLSSSLAAVCMNIQEISWDDISRPLTWHLHLSFSKCRSFLSRSPTHTYISQSITMVEVTESS